MFALLAALSLQLAPAPARSPALSLEANLTGIFASDGEAVNFSAHAAWSVAAPLAGQALFGRPGLWGAGGTWIAYSLLNEFALHGPESERERTLNLVSRLAPCAVILFIDLVGKGFGLVILVRRRSRLPVEVWARNAASSVVTPDVSADHRPRLGVREVRPGHIDRERVLPGVGGSQVAPGCPHGVARVAVHRRAPLEGRAASRQSERADPVRAAHLDSRFPVAG